MIHLSPLLAAPKRFRRRQPSDAGFERWPAEIACIQSVHARGFGFAQPLTGASDREIFLNESRIAALRQERPTLEGAVIAVQTVEKIDGRRSALRAQLVDMTDTEAARQLWQQVAHNRGVNLQATAPVAALRPDQPVLLPLALALLDAGASQGGAMALVRQLPAQAWTDASAELRPPLEQADADVKSAAVRHFAATDPVVAFRHLRSTRIGSFAALAASDIDKLWTGLESQRDAFIDWLETRGREAPTPALLAWAASKADGDGDDVPVGWQVIGTAMGASGATWPTAWDTWPALQSAPATLAWSLARLRYPDWRAGMTALLDSGPLSIAQLSFDADAVMGSLDERDLRLAGLWAPAPSDEDDVIGRRRQVQMQTARAAEKCALRYFEGFGQTVRDIAITQLDGGDRAWAVMDLALDGRHGIDVKNCRRTPMGGLRSGKWKVKAFKSDAAGNPVTLLGVSSPYTQFGDGGRLAPYSRGPADRYMPQAVRSTAMVVLGVTNASEMHRLMARFSDIADIDMPAAQRLSEMPVWAWDYPGFHYRQRDENLAALRMAFERHREPLMQRLLACVPLVLPALLDLDVPLAARTALEAQQRAYLQALRLHWRAERQRRREASQVPQVPRLPWMYLFTLHAWLQWRLSGRPSNTSCIAALFRPAEGIEDGTHAGQRRTLASRIGILDPADTLDALLNALTRLDETLPAATLVGMTRFTLQPNGIFRSTFADGKKRTLIAHCGGRQANLTECGNGPLVYGQSETCACGRLICKVCQSCTTPAVPCEHELKRKAVVQGRMPGTALPASSVAGRRFGWSEM